MDYSIQKSTQDIKTAQGIIKPELVLKEANIVNVFTGTITKGDIAVSNGKIMGVGNYDGITNIDAGNGYVLPGFINAHCHVESSMVTPYNYACGELMWGTTTIITDPHEIVNVAGHAGIEYILEAAKNSPVNYYVQLPSCVPATTFENAGAVIKAEDLEKYKDNPYVLGLGEMMNYVGVLACDEDVLKKLNAFKDMVIDGHAPGVSGNDLNAYIMGGMATDHESITYEEAIEKVSKGMAVLIREGGASKNLEAIITGVLKNNNTTSNMAFATDDKHLYDIYKEGTIRNNIVKAVKLGMDPVEAVCIATINAARIYGLKNVGAIAPGYVADMVLVDNLKDFNVFHVYKDGVLVAKNGEILLENTDTMTAYGKEIINSVNINKITKEDLVVEMRQEYPVMEMIPGQIVTGCRYLSKEEVDKLISTSEILKIAVIERHNKTGNIGTGYIMGYGLKNGAVATTVAHDSHNLIVVGDNDEDMLRAIEKIVSMQGGYAISSGNEVSGMPLDICGLMSRQEPKEFIKCLEDMINKAKALGVKDGIDPFTTLSFMALPVIPSLRITDMGMFDVNQWKLV